MSTEGKYYQYNPEKRNIFIEMHRGRTNEFGNIILGIFMMFSSHASAIVEVFLRKRFGERYITMAQSISLFLVLNVSNIWLSDIFNLGMGSILFLFLFSCIYLGLSIYHRSEIKKYGTTYDFKRFSYSDGELNSFWYKVFRNMSRGMKVSSYDVSVFFEPLVPIVIGIIFTIIPITKLVGIILIFCGIVYSFRNFHKAQQGRNWVLDNIDKKIANEMKYDVFIGRKPKQDTKGVYIPIELPEDEETRKLLYNMVEGSFGETHDIWENDSLDDNNHSGGNGSSGGAPKENNGGDISGGFSKENGGIAGNGFTNNNRVGNGLTNNDGQEGNGFTKESDEKGNGLIDKDGGSSGGGNGLSKGDSSGVGNG